MEKRKIKPRELKPSVKRLIFTRAIREKNTPREYLANELIREIKKLGEIPPSFETAKRYISKARNVDNPIDSTWTLSCCSEYSQFFPPDSIPILIDYKSSMSQFDNDDKFREYFKSPMSDITIRHAIWIIRLEPIIKLLTPKLMIENEPLPELYTAYIANIYAMAEMASEISGEDHFDSCDLDKFLFTGDIVSFARTAYISGLETGKPCHNNGNCDSCDWFHIPDIKMCIPKRKEGTK